MLTAEEAAQEYGYLDTNKKPSPAKWRRAVRRGVLPLPKDPGARPQLWSRYEIDAALMPQENRENIDPRQAEMNKRLGIG